jgi:hypothetical protein
MRTFSDSYGSGGLFFLGMGEKDVAVPFNAVHVTNKNNNKWYLVMNSTKDALKSAKGFKYDRNATTWVPEERLHSPAHTRPRQECPAAPPSGWRSSPRVLAACRL